MTIKLGIQIRNRIGSITFEAPKVLELVQSLLLDLSIEKYLYLN